MKPPATAWSDEEMKRLPHGNISVLTRLSDCLLGEEDSSRVLRRPAAVHVLGEGPVRLHHGRHAEPVLPDQEEAKGRGQTGVTEAAGSTWPRPSHISPPLPASIQLSPTQADLLLCFCTKGLELRIKRCYWDFYLLRCNYISASLQAHQTFLELGLCWVLINH